MITKIGVIYEDRISRGFLYGLRDRLRCDAEFVDPPGGVPRAPRLPRKGVKRAWRYFQKQGVELVVRFTDADRDRWQDVRRHELDVVPDQASSVWICGVAVNNPEEWMCQDIPYLAETLGLTQEELQDSVHRTDRIKRALARMRRAKEGQSDVVARIVRDAPPEVFRRWLKDDALRAFYSDCRAAAKRADCETPNELDALEDG